MLVIKLKDGNSKLAKHVGTWSITAGFPTCGRECTGCYALKIQKLRPVVASSWEANFKVSQEVDFSERMVVHKKFKYVRVHASGDFYSQEYINKWVKIAERYPDVIFYAYTKRMQEFDFKILKSLKNFILHDSLKSGVINYAKDISKTAEKFGGFVCPDTLEDKGERYCGSGCTWCMQKCNENVPIFFEKH